ncbi:non-heme chloroperoxidase [Ilyonectria sp. MPI-CAGE-AT-0026]|nr:non-heme chloroperoxidase [Ilyonectria sp. MPI-CAGE-AT-0026]
MPTLTLRDGTEIWYKVWGNPEGQPVTFSHGWPLNADNWDSQAYFLASQGYRVIAHDRRGHGRSSQPWEGNDLTTYADDLNQLIEHLDLRNIAMVGHSTGGGEVARYVGKYGTGRVSKAVLISAITPLMLQTESNPEGLPIGVFDSFREAMVKDRAQFFLDVPNGPFFGFNRPGVVKSEGLVQSWWLQGMMAGFKNVYDCVKAFSETDLNEDLKKMDIPVLLLHGDDDQVVPIQSSALKAIKVLPQGTLKVYPGGPHALPNICCDEVNKDLLEFLKA